MNRRCRWDDWNREHIAKHGVSPHEAAYVVLDARPPYPRKTGDGKWLVWGQTAAGRYLQVVFTEASNERIDFDLLSSEDILQLSDDDVPQVYVVHARDLNDREKRSFRRSR
jgi:uncharacterized DUF497 family protein